MMDTLVVSNGPNHSVLSTSGKTHPSPCRWHRNTLEAHRLGLLHRDFQAPSLELAGPLHLLDLGIFSIRVKINPHQPSSIPWISSIQSKKQLSTPVSLTPAPVWAIGLQHSRHLVAGLCFSPGTATGAEVAGNQRHAGRGCSGGPGAGRRAAGAVRTCGTRVRLG